MASYPGPHHSLCAHAVAVQVSLIPSSLRLELLGCRAAAAPCLRKAWVRRKERGWAEQLQGLQERASGQP